MDQYELRESLLARIEFSSETEKSFIYEALYELEHEIITIEECYS